MKITTDTLRAPLNDPHYGIMKHGYDGGPREWVSEGILAAPCWAINYAEDGFNEKEIAVVTDFPNEGPMVTMTVLGRTMTFGEKTLEALCDEVIRVHLISISHNPDDDDTPHSAPVPVDWAEEEEIVAVELPIDETLWDDLTPKQKKIFIKDWVADFMANTDCSKAVAKIQYEQWLNQEAQYARDEYILCRRFKKDGISEEEEAEIAAVAAAESPEYPVQWESDYGY